MDGIKPPSFSLLNSSNSQGLAQLDSLSSLPSEPPEIGKWLSSYRYESPKLNIGEDWECWKNIRGNDCENAGYDLKEVDKLKESLGELREGEKRDKLVGNENLDPEGLIRCNNAFANKDSASQVLDSADSLLLTSEPTDIKNWFSSYVYESPAVPSSDDIGFSDSEENIVDTEQCVAEIISSEKEALRGTIGIGRNHNFVGEKLTLSGTGKSKRSVETNEYEYPHKGNNEFDMGRALSAPTDFPFKRTSELILEGIDEKDHDVHDNVPCKDAEISRFPFKDSTKKLHEDFSGAGSYLSFPSDRSLVHKEGNVQREELNASVHIESDMIAVDGDKLKEAGRTSDKENEGNDVTANGFISTRKSTSRRENDENILTSSAGHHQSSWLKNSVKSTASGYKNVTAQRKVLSETTNFHHSDAPEITGKWRCPQKSKPNLGPPLKQLRIDQWVSRV